MATSLIGVTDECYRALRRSLDAGKRATLIDHYGAEREVIYDEENEVYEPITGRRVVTMSSVDPTGPGTVLSELAKIALEFGAPIFHRGSLQLFWKGGRGAIYDASREMALRFEKGKCWACGKEMKHRCSKCRLAQYCSQGCQSADWSTHKLVCRRLAAMI